MAKKTDYKNPTEAGNFLIGVVFLIIGLDDNIAFILIGMCFVFLGMKANNKNEI